MFLELIKGGLCSIILEQPGREKERRSFHRRQGHFQTRGRVGASDGRAEDEEFHDSEEPGLSCMS